MGDLRAFARQHFNTVNRCTDRNITNRQRIPHLNRRFQTRQNRLARLKSFRRNDVTPFAIGIPQKYNMRALLQIIFRPLNDGLDMILVAPESDDAITPLVPAAPVTGCDASMMGASRSFMAHAQQWSEWLAFVQILADDFHHSAPA